MTRAISLTVNGSPIGIDYFVQEFIDHVTAGMLESLEGTSPIKKLDLSIKGDHVTIDLNGKAVPVNAFVTKVVRSTVVGMVSPLKGVSQVESLDIKIDRDV